MSPSDTKVHINCNFLIEIYILFYCFELFKFILWVYIRAGIRGGISGVLHGYYMGLRRGKGVLYWVLWWGVT